jgi:hypothetical protein
MKRRWNINAASLIQATAINKSYFIRLGEVLCTSQRIVVLQDHEKVREFAGKVAADKIMQAMAGIL